MKLRAIRPAAAAVLFSCATVSVSIAGGPSPGYYLPDTDGVRRFVSGRNVVIGTIGDSLAFPTFGQLIPGSMTHVNWGIGLRRECAFHEGLRALWVPDGVFRNADGVGANNHAPGPGGLETEHIRVLPRLGGDTTNAYFGVPGANLEPQSCTEIHWKEGGTPPANTILLNFELYGDEGAGALISTPFPTEQSLAILRGNLRAAVYVYRSHGRAIPTGLSADVVDRSGVTLLSLVTPVPIPPLGAGEPDDWFPVEFDLSGVNTSAPGGKTRSLRFRVRTYSDTSPTPAGSTLYVRGCLFYDADSDGANIVPLAGKGGWNTANLRFDQPGAGGGTQEDTAEAFGRAAVGAGFGDPGQFRVLVVGIGQNINANGQVSGSTTTSIYTEDVRTLVHQRVDAIESAGGAVDRVLLLGTHPWGPAGSTGEINRAKTRCDRLYELAVEEDWWYVGVPYLVDPWPASNYFTAIDYHLSLAGSLAYGSALWGAFVEAAGAWPCLGDSSGDGVVDFGDIVETLSRWQEPRDYRFGAGDADGDAEVDFGDIGAVLANWGSQCP